MGEAREEKARKDTNWEPGPDGSTDVGQDKDPVEGDVFVGKNNQAGWEAGPDGAITNWSFDQFQEQLYGAHWYACCSGSKVVASSDGHGLWFDKDASLLAP